MRIKRVKIEFNWKITEKRGIMAEIYLDKMEMYIYMKPDLPGWYYQ